MTKNKLDHKLNKSDWERHLRMCARLDELQDKLKELTSELEDIIIQDSHVCYAAMQYYNESDEDTAYDRYVKEFQKEND